MLDLSKYESLGAALRDALERWPDEVCLIEADREREKARLTYRQFKRGGASAGCGVAGARFSRGGSRGHHHDESIEVADFRVRDFLRGGVLVPLDYKLTPKEHLALLAHSQSSVLITEYAIWRAILEVKGAGEIDAKTVLVTEAPANAELGGALRWEEFRVGQARAGICAAQAQRLGLHRVFLRYRWAAEGLRADA